MKENCSKQYCIINTLLFAKSADSKIYFYGINYLTFIVSRLGRNENADAARLPQRRRQAERDARRSDPHVREGRHTLLSGWSVASTKWTADAQLCQSENNR